MARDARRIIEDELSEHGDMDSDFLFGNDADRAPVWVGDNEFLVYIKRSCDIIFIGLEDDYDNTREVWLLDMSPSDIIEIADFLCHR